MLLALVRCLFILKSLSSCFPAHINFHYSIIKLKNILKNKAIKFNWVHNQNRGFDMST
jgi:hypothetical protein